MSIDLYDSDKVEGEAQYWEEYFGMKGSPLATGGEDLILSVNAEIREENAGHHYD